MNAFQSDGAERRDVNDEDIFDDDIEEFDVRDVDDVLDDDDELDDDGLDDDDELDDDDDDDLDEDDDDDIPEDASEEDVDFVVALYREGGDPVVAPLPFDLANDLEELILSLRRMPGDFGALGAVSVAGEFFVLCRVRGRSVHVMLSDAVAANDWPIARDVVDYLNLDIPDPDDDSEAVGDLDILADQGIDEFALEAFLDDDETDSDEVVAKLAAKLHFGPQFERTRAASTW